jgi:hypothetical protein
MGCGASSTRPTSRVARVLRILSRVSVAVSVLSALAWLMCGRTGLGNRYLQVAPRRFVTIDVWPHATRIFYFNDPMYGPYTGSIISISPPGGPPPTDLKATYFGDIAGLYYRDFRWADGRRLWTLAVSVFCPMFGGEAAALAFAVLAKRRDIAARDERTQDPGKPV